MEKHADDEDYVSNASESDDGDGAIDEDDGGDENSFTGSVDYYEEDDPLLDEPFDENSDEEQKGEAKGDAFQSDDEEEDPLYMVSSSDEEEEDGDEDTPGHISSSPVIHTSEEPPKPVEYEYHPECVIHNMDEVETMSLVLRNSKGYIVDQFHKTSPFLTKYEKTKILGLRVHQLNEGSAPLTKLFKPDMDNFDIAKLELQEKRMPFIIRRLTPNGEFEYWKLEDLEIL